MVKLYSPKQGDLAWLTLDPTLGHEQRGRRPVMVISNTSYNQIGMALVCPITSSIKGYPFEVELKTKKLGGVVLADQIRAVDWKLRRLKFIESADASSLKQVQKYLGLLIST